MVEYIIKKEGKIICPICKYIFVHGYNKCVNYCCNCGVRLLDKENEDLKDNKNDIGKECYIIYGRKLIKSKIVNQSDKYYSVQVGSGIRNYLKEKVIFDNINNVE